MLLLEPISSFFQVRLLVTNPSENLSKGGILLPEKAAEKTRVAEVLAAGPGMYNPFNGGRFDHGIRVGDLVYLNQHAPVKVEHLPEYKQTEPETYLIAESDIFCVYMRYEEAKAAGLSSDEVSDARWKASQSSAASSAASSATTWQLMQETSSRTASASSYSSSLSGAPEGPDEKG